MEMVSAAQCGRVLGALRSALAWLGRMGQVTGDAQPCLPPRGARALPVSATEERRFSSSVNTMPSLTTCFDSAIPHDTKQFTE